MKKISLLLSLLSSFVFYSDATHDLGGEITWRCLGNGDYIFYLNVYYECGSIGPSVVNSETITIHGASLPTDGTNVINSITVTPDSNLWNTYGQGNISPRCSSGPIPCNGSNTTVIKMLQYRSDPITLLGVPPASGWTFYNSRACCRGNALNIGPLGASPSLYRAVMYQNTTNGCLTSSPLFSEVPDYYVCSDIESTISYVSEKGTNDSLIYSLDQSLVGTPNSLAFISYQTGFSPTNPTPDSNFDSTNIPFTLKSKTGLATVRARAIGNYNVIVKVDAYNNGSISSSVYRDMVLVFNNCSLLSTGMPNNAPTISINGQVLTGDIYYDTVTVKQTLQLPIQVSDIDLNNNSAQQLRLVISGEQLTNTRGAGSLCGTTAGVEPCAYLQNQGPFLNQNLTPSQYVIEGLAAIPTQFVWTPNCDLLWKGNPLNPNAALESPRTHYFLLQAEDDFCPNPGKKYVTMAITVMPDSVLCQNIVTGVEESELSFSEAVTLYPNPTNGFTTIDLGREEKEVELSVRNIQGKLLQQLNASTAQRLELEIEGEAGLYFVEIINTKGDRATLKVIKQ